MAVSKTLTANGSKGHHKFTLTVNESSTSGNSSFMSYSFTIAPIQSGWDWYGFNIPYSITIGSNTYTGSISSYNGSSTVTLKSGSNIEIAHDTDGTKTINVSFTVTDNTGQSYTCGNASASGSMTLTALHKAPEIETAEMTETNQAMISLGVPNTTVVRWLSQKQITLHATAYDSATLTYKLRHPGFNYELPTSGYQSSNVFNADYRTNEFGISNNLAYIQQLILDNKGGTASGYVRILKNGNEALPDAIPYAKPSIERTSTNIKRKSGGGVNLTDNKVSLNLKATIYKANDIIGNNNSITQIGYKIWDTDDTEPANYTTLTPTVDSSGNVTVTDLEISNISYINVYNYKIIITDSYGYSDLIDDGIISTGVSVWTEYKDRVDFYNLTKQGNEIFSNIYSTNEIVIGTFLNKPLYRKVGTITFTSTYSGSGSHTKGSLVSSNIEYCTVNSIFRQKNGAIGLYNSYNSTIGSSIYVENASGNANKGYIMGFTNRSDMLNETIYVAVEYTKTTD